MRKRDIALALGALTGAAVTAALKEITQIISITKEPPPKVTVPDSDTKAHFVGGGFASLAGAAYLVRDCEMNGSNITIYEEKHPSADNNPGSFTGGLSSMEEGLLDKKACENFWELFSSIPSLEAKERSVTEEIFNFNRLHPIKPQARLIDKNGKIQEITGMGFNLADRKALGKLMIIPEDELDDMTILQWFSDTPHFFETNFWYIWQTTYSFQKHSSLLEFKRCIERMIFKFPKLDASETAIRTPYNQYESILLPLKAYLAEKGVTFIPNATVTDLDFENGDGISVTAIHITMEGQETIIPLAKKDICLMNTDYRFDNTTYGSLREAAPYHSYPSASKELWEKVAAKKPNLGNPESFFSHPEVTSAESFTVTCKGNRLLKLIEKYSGNIPGSGELMTFKDSNWLMSIEIPAQPYFKSQPLETTVLFGNGLYPDKIGNYVQKPMKDCTGAEVLTELIYHLQMQDKQTEILTDIINVIPCRMPYKNASSKPRKMAERPPVVPEGSSNFGMVGLFTDIQEDTTATMEYSVRSARTAVYSLMGVTHKKICPVSPLIKNPKILARAFDAAYR